MKKIGLLYAFLFFLLLEGGAKALAASHSDPVTVCQSSELAAMSMNQLDAPLITYTVGASRYFIHSENSGDTFQLFSGTLDAPCGTLEWEKTRAQLFTNPSAIQGMPWLVSAYQDPNGLLAFVHVEHAGASTDKGKIGLAWSTDFGNTFTYLGDIVVPYGNPDFINVQGAPYIIKEGYFYVYYSDANAPNVQGAAVARAKVSDVIAAAKNGTVTSWSKYYNGAWSESGIGGNFTPLVQANGITHTSAAYSTYSGKYYLATTVMAWYGSQSPTWIKLWESSDGINWTLSQTVAEDIGGNLAPNAGFQYVTIVGTNGNSNGTVGQTFYLYSGLKPYESDKAVRRWTIDLAGTTTAATYPALENITRKVSYSSSSNLHSTQTADKAFDRSPLTNWQAAAGSGFNGQWLMADFGAATPFNKVVLTEYGSRTTGYRIEYWDGASWQTAYTGTSIGATQVPKTITFPEVIAQKVRIYFTSGSVVPIIYEFEVYDDPSPINLAHTKTFSSSSDLNASQSADKAFDQLLPTNWQSDGSGFSGQWLAVDFGDNRTFNTAVLNEFGNRTSGYRIEYWNGSSWLTAYTGTTIGDYNAYKLVTFPAVTGSKARLYFTSGTGSPIIYEFELYNRPSASNLATGKSYASSSNLDATQTASKAFDLSPVTNWQAAAGTGYTGTWLQVDFGAATTFNEAVISEYGYRTTGYRIEYWNGSDWLTAYSGTTIGDFYHTKTIVFPAVTGSKARIYYLSGSVVPIVYEWELYYRH
ncbi:discoidin domain-containing protein [Cohnella soli]|uniref:Discoidin domain-containing protein n=1 Tax=Cohnella soli TaxID=425005 RepID=A0ABW0I4X5_9BACL